MSTRKYILETISKARATINECNGENKCYNVETLGFDKTKEVCESALKEIEKLILNIRRSAELNVKMVGVDLDSRIQNYNIDELKKARNENELQEFFYKLKFVMADIETLVKKKDLA